MFDKINSFDKTIFVNGAGLAAVASGRLQTPAIVLSTQLHHQRVNMS
jgi:hypothetical protein